MRIYAGESNLDEVEVGQNLGYAGNPLTEDFDRSQNISWEQFQRLLDVIGSDKTEEDFVNEITEYILDHADIEEEVNSWDEDEPYSRASQEFDWEWEKEGFVYRVKGEISGTIDTDPGDYWTPPHSSSKLTDLSITSAEVSLADDSIETFEDREDWDYNGDMEQWYDLWTDIPNQEIESNFKQKI